MILTCDPGESTGIWIGDAQTCAYHTTVDFSAVPWFLKEISEKKIWEQVEIIVTEEFRIFPWASNAQRFSVLKPVQVIGMLMLFAYLQDTVMVFQQPSAVKTFCQARKVKLAQLGTPHEMSAAQHAYYFFKTNPKRREK